MIAPARIEEIKGDDAKLEIVVRKGFRAMTSFTLADAKIDKNKLEVPIGFRVDGEYGEQVLIEIKEENNAHMLVVGGTSSGKTNTVLYFLTNLLKRFSPDELQIAITVDNQDFEAFDDYPEYYYMPRPSNPMDEEDTPKTIIKLFTKLNEEQRKRESLFREWNQKHRGINNLHKYHEKSKNDPEMPKLPFIYVVFEEIGVNISKIERLSTQVEAENAEETKKLRNSMKSFNTYLGEILRYSRKYGIYFIFISQIVGDMKNSIQQNVRYKIAHQITERESLSLFEKPDASKLTDKQGFIQIGTDNTNLIKFKSPLAETEGILRELKKFIDKKE